MTNLIIVAVLLLILGGAAWYIISAKKKGKKCIGCPSNDECSAKYAMYNCRCCSDE